MAFCKTLIICLSAISMIILSEARLFNVGNRNGSWKIPSPPDSLDRWSQINRFQIGDSIVFKYDGKRDSVLEVNEADYKTCNKSNPIKSQDDGDTTVTFDKSGLFYFISGAQGHCEKAQKLAIRVLAAHHHRRSAAAPTPVDGDRHSSRPAPAPAPHNGGAALRFGFFGGAAVALVVGFV